MAPNEILTFQASVTRHTSSLVRSSFIRYPVSVVVQLEIKKKPIEFSFDFVKEIKRKIMLRSLLVAFALLAICNVCLSNDETSARLLVSKQILNKYLVEKSDLLVRYTIYNVGNGAATQIKIVDNGFHPQAFDIVGGQPTVTIQRMAPHTNYTHVLVVRPKHYGYFNFTAAEVTYKTGENVEKLQMAVSSEPGEGGIVNLNEFNKRFSSHFFDWLAFGIMTVPSLAIPFALWHMSRSKYERYGGKHKKH